MTEASAKPAPGIQKQTIALALFIVLCFAAASLGGLATSLGLKSWYETLAKPSWNPPNWIFGPVWSALFLSMAVAAWLVWRTSSRQNTQLAMGLFGLQLLLNTLWSNLFFGMQRPDLAAIEILVLWLAIAATIWAFAKHSRSAAVLLVPYLLWVSFASILNITIWLMNRG